MDVVIADMLPERDWRVIQMHLTLKWTEDTKGIIAFDKDKNRLVGAVVFQMWTHSSALVHMWLDSPMVIKHRFLDEIANYFFNTAERDLMIGMVPGDNEAALKLNKHIGFRETHRIPGGYMHDIDWVIMEANAEDVARWLPKEEAA